jgi:hypothetical protein
LGVYKVYWNKRTSAKKLRDKRLSLTYDRQEPEVKFTGQYTRWQLPQEAFQQTSNGMGIPILIRSQKIHVALYKLIKISETKKRGTPTSVKSVFQTLDYCRAATEPIDALLLVCLLGFQILNGSEHYRREVGYLCNIQSVFQ